VIRDASLNILVCRSSRAWKSRDLLLLREFIANAGMTPLVLLNGVSIDVFESSMGELPLKRSSFRRYIKRLASLEFNSKESF